MRPVLGGARETGRMARSRRSAGGRRRLRAGDICDALALIAPPALAAEWDNVGLIIGDRSAGVRRLLLAIDLTGPVVGEARRCGAEMVMAYHPPIFHPLSRLTPDSAPAAFAAARADLVVYSMHTALDAAPGGTNDVLAEAIGLTDARPLKPAAAGSHCKLVVFLPPEDLPRVASAAFRAGAGGIGRYAECSFRTAGVGTFRGESGSRPAVGRPGRREQVEELRLEMVVPGDRLGQVVRAVRAAHGYETPAIDVYRLQPLPDAAGAGRIGRLAGCVSRPAFVARVKRALGLRRVLLAGPRTGRVSTAACCAGSGGGLLRAAIAAGADAYVTGELGHHDALAAAAAGLTIICAGHSHSERIALPALAGRIRRALPGLHVRVSRADRDPMLLA